MAERIHPHQVVRRGTEHSSRQATIFLIRSKHLGWLGLQAALGARRDVCVVGNVRGVAQVVPTVAALDPHPQVILAPAQLDGAPALPLIAQLRTLCPEARIIVIGDEKLPGHDTLTALLRLTAVSYLLWEDLTDEALPLSLATVLNTGLVVVSPAAVTRLADPPGRRLPVSVIVLSADERAVLEGLDEGLTQREIALAEHVSESTVERTLAALRNRLGVATTNTLCAKAGRLGLVGQSRGSDGNPSST